MATPTTKTLRTTTDAAILADLQAAAEARSLTAITNYETVAGEPVVTWADNPGVVCSAFIKSYFTNGSSKEWI
jgi:hypothetical protein